MQAFKKAILCLANIMDVNLVNQSDSHTDGTVSSMPQYLGLFHATKYVFLHLRAGKGAQQGAVEAHKNWVKD